MRFMNVQFLESVYSSGHLAYNGAVPRLTHDDPLGYPSAFYRKLLSVLRSTSDGATSPPSSGNTAKRSGLLSSASWLSSIRSSAAKMLFSS